MPRIFVVAGPNGAGKSTTAPVLLREHFGVSDYVNADTIAAGLSAFAPERAALAAGRVMLNQFLSQMFDYANTAIEKRFIFYRRLLPLLEFGREREGIDLSKLTLTHHNLRNKGVRTLSLVGGEYPKLDPMQEAGGGQIREKEKAHLSEIIERVPKAEKMTFEGLKELTSHFANSKSTSSRGACDVD
jgi:hypothetical protein